ncbi:AraC family transcriptional regulator [Sorangium cellulosum]|uniref:AraC family transcriptional regulator n=1 Tax=Sorangium cellulosum TaxID=56 RepID=A0A150Q7A2_SORCE|nr:AraC family transcriptional regulator [Sorangium cellulosum]KYF63743.1 AraC family transcriptional regulator [Sorangium cellulosum]
MAAREHTALVDEGGVHVVEDAGGTRRHALHLVKLVVPVDGPLRVEREGARPLEVRAPVLTGAGVAHAIIAPGPTVTAFLPPGGLGAGAQVAVRGRVLALEGAQAERVRAAAREVLRGRLDNAAARELMTACARAFTPERPPVDRRVLRAMRRLAEQAPERPALGPLAAAEGLSRSRLSHLFHDAFGHPLRDYVTFLRVMAAVRALVDGAAPARAALAGGFHDQAHLARAVAATLGRTPGAVARSHFVQAPAAPGRMVAP